MTEPRKRKPGGGRKAKGEFSELSASLSLRMPNSLRKQIDAAADKSGRSASQETIRRLQSSFGPDRLTTDKQTRAICFLISEVAQKISWRIPDKWHRHPFLFQAFKIGVAKLLEGIEPKGEAKAAFEGWKTPDTMGDEAADRTLAEFFGGGVSSDGIKGLWQVLNEPGDEDLKRLAERAMIDREGQWHAMANARRDLQIKPKKSVKHQ